MAKRPFIRKQKRKRHGATFWDSEYTNPAHLKLSNEHSGDLEKFIRWLARQADAEVLNRNHSVLDLGCGNGRNLIFLARQFGVRGVGYDISSAAIAQAIAASKKLPLTYTARTIAGTLPLKDESQSLVLDIMTSHVLSEKERQLLRDEIHRVLIPGGWLFMKTFLRDGDKHTERLMSESPASERGSYRHPVIGVDEHVYYEEELQEFLTEKFLIHKVYRSHKHISKGRAWKRRTISVYAQKDPYA